MEKTVRIHNSQRLLKKESERKYNTYCLTPPKKKMKRTIYYCYYETEQKKGYDYQSKSRVMKWMHEDFEGKMMKYLGGSMGVKRLKRMDKVKLKEQLNFTNQINPLVTIFGRVNYKIQESMLLAGFDALRNYRGK